MLQVDQDIFMLWVTVGINLPENSNIRPVCQQPEKSSHTYIGAEILEGV
jgi:hypothetical protein